MHKHQRINHVVKSEGGKKANTCLKKLQWLLSHPE